MRLYKKFEISARYLGRKIIVASYRGVRLVWQAVRSCFGSGSWSNHKPWSNKDGWSNN